VIKKKRENTMMKHVNWIIVALALALVAGPLADPNRAAAATAEEIIRDSVKALEDLYAKSATAKALGEKSKGILVFPGIIKGGFLVGGQYGEGALLVKGESGGAYSYKVVGYYNTIQGSFGLQAGLQKFGYALFFMSDSAKAWLDKSDGWELGTGPTITIVDIGAATSFSTTTLQSDINAFFFDQKGLMAGLGLAGTKVTRIKK
jgi:lipid-binding SYLF domain-containing protein